MVKEKIKPYFGGGLGMAKLKVESGGIDNQVQFLPSVIQGKLGFSFVLDSKIRPYVGYKCFYLMESQSLSSMRAARYNSAGYIGKINNDVVLTQDGKDTNIDALRLIAVGRGNDAVKKSDDSFVEVDGGNKLITSSIVLPRGGYDKKITTSYVLQNIEFGLRVPLNF